MAFYRPGSGFGDSYRHGREHDKAAIPFRGRPPYGPFRDPGEPSQGSSSRPRDPRSNSRSDQDFRAAPKHQDPLGKEDQAYDVPKSMPSMAIGRHQPQDSFPQQKSTSQRLEPPSIQDAPSEQTASAPRDMQHDLACIRDYVDELRGVRCHSCKASWVSRASISDHVESILASVNPEQGSSLKGVLGAVPCSTSGCHALTCLGCGRDPSLSSKESERVFYHFGICCSDGALPALFVVTSMMDMLVIFEGQQERKQERPTAIGRSTPQGKARNTGKGYDRAGSNMLRQAPLSFSQPLLRRHLKQADPLEDDVRRELLRATRLLLRHRTCLTNGVAMAFFGTSTVLEVIAHLIRNDSLDEILKREGIYMEALAVIESLWGNSATKGLIRNRRSTMTITAGLLSLATDHEAPHVLTKDGAPPIMDALADINVTSETILSAAEAMPNEYQDDYGRAQLKACKRISEVARKLGVRSMESTMQSTKLKSRSEWHKIQDENRVEFVEDEVIRRDFVYDTFLTIHRTRRGRGPRDRDALDTVLPGRMKRLVKEISSMMTSLPEGIFVKVAERQPDHLRAAIFGPRDTVYFGGLFEFDIYCGPNYPNSPPNVSWTSRNGIKMINPVIHMDKVCLSILEPDWSGRGSETWQPTVSSLYQVLVSIQTFIFTDDPAGAGNPMFHVKQPKDANDQYQQAVIFGYILPWLNGTLSPGAKGMWGHLAQEYYKSHGQEVLRVVRASSVYNPYLRQTRRVRFCPFIPEGVDLVHELETALQRLPG